MTPLLLFWYVVAVGAALLAVLLMVLVGTTLALAYLGWLKADESLDARRKAL